MAISINKYIDITSKVVSAAVGTRDFSGLVFSSVAMNETVESDYTAIKTSYDAGDPVAMTYDGIKACFASDSDIVTFAGKYFGYSGGNHAPSVLNLAKVLTSGSALETAKTAFDRVTGNFSNFGAFTFLGSFTDGSSGDGGLLDVASDNDSSDHLFVIVKNGTDESTAKTTYADFTMVQLVIATVASGTNYGAWMTLAWYASVDYDKTDASSTMDYKQFVGQGAEVTTDSVKTTYDTDHVNYVGLVQVNGTELKFFQTGVNMDGTDTGVVRDRVWIEGEIAAGWFNLTASTTKVPANYVGAALVRTMIVSVATQAISNGSILIEKAFTDTQKTLIQTYAGTEDAVAQVQSDGYYVSTKITKPSGSTSYVCEYTLVYAKGDHIGKVTGTNYLV